MRPRIEVTSIDCDPKNIVIKNLGFVDFDEFLDETFDRLKLRLSSVADGDDDVLWIETRFYATYLDDEQCKVPFIHSISAFGISLLIFAREFRVFKDTVKRSIKFEILDRFKLGVWEALDEINALEFTVSVHDDYPRYSIAPDFN